MGDNDVPCQSAQSSFIDCCVPANPIPWLPPLGPGALSLSNASYKPAYTAANGWDFATGLGSINVANLIANWK